MRKRIEEEFLADLEWSVFISLFPRDWPIAALVAIKLVEERTTSAKPNPRSWPQSPRVENDFSVEIDQQGGKSLRKPRTWCFSSAAALIPHESEIFRLPLELSTRKLQNLYQKNWNANGRKIFAIQWRTQASIYTFYTENYSNEGVIP